MTGASTRLTAAVEAYFADLGRIRASGGATGERSSYGPLANLLNAVGATLKPKVFCVGELADQGAGHPDFGLYTARQVQRGRPREGQTPERGMVEVKAAGGGGSSRGGVSAGAGTSAGIGVFSGADASSRTGASLERGVSGGVGTSFGRGASFGEDAWLTAAGEQVSRYWDRYRLVLVTNTRDFVLVGEDAAGRAAKLETFRLADSAEDFHRKLEKPRAFAREVGAGLGEYLCRALSHRAALAEPKDVAWLLASYARDGLARVEAAGDAPSLEAVRKALEEALGVRFEGGKGARFFRSTLVQTLFYGVFSAWVLWARAGAEGDAGGGGSSRSGGRPSRFGGGSSHSGGGPSPEGDDGKLDAPDGPRMFGSHPAPLSAGDHGAGTTRFDWRTAVWHLRVPVLAALFQQLAAPGRLQPLGLVEVLDWTAAALDRVDRPAFFARFHAGEGAEQDSAAGQDPAAGQSPAVPYFYEPFLEAFDPALRKQLGVWYTPAEVVRYMVARVDRALKDDLGIEDGLAAEHVYVLDPCCGTGAYLAEVLRRIAANLEGRGLGALAGARVKQAATGRVFGFELMPAPFVVAHLQVGLTMQDLDAPLSDDGAERAGIFLTNALTGWEPRTTKPLPFPELEEERDRAGRVKQDTPILVILGNPPYNGFAGMAVDEEQEFLEAYRTGKRVRLPDSRALHDLYVRFFRMAERRIVEKTGQGVVCFISNYSWLDGRSFAGMRERYLEAFDAIRIDCLNGDKYKTGKVAPDGSPDPSIFSTERDPVGIQVGTAIATLVRKTEHVPAEAVGFRHLWGQAKRAELMATAEDVPSVLYEEIKPVLSLGLPLVQTAVSKEWFDWPALPDLFPVNFSGVNTNRDAFVIDIDLARLKSRITDYFDKDLDDEQIGKLYPSAMGTRARYDPRAVRRALRARGGPDETGFIRHAYRPFDIRWLYWEADTKLLNEKRPDYRPHVFEGNIWLSAAPHLRKGATEPQACVIRQMASLHLIERGANLFPVWLSGDDIGNDSDGTRRRPNLSGAARRYLESLGLSVEDLFHHVLAVLHDPSYRKANAGALAMEWPRIPLPGWPPGSAGVPPAWTINRAFGPLRAGRPRSQGPGIREPQAGPSGQVVRREAAHALAQSAARGRELARLLDSDTPVPGVTSGRLRPEIAAIAVPATTDGRNMSGDDFALTAGWGHYGTGGAVMPGQGRIVERPFTPEERAALGDALPVLGETTFDIHLNARAFWRNVPAAVWGYKLGGYQVLKKWLSYRERAILGRPLHPEEVQYFADTARRIGAILSATA